jgi:hypothetical protein
MNKLVQQIVNEVKLQIFKEQDLGEKNIIAIYPGRFQPMGRHHKAAYDWLTNQFGVKNTYVVTSDKTDQQKSPFNFVEKKKIINKHGIKNVVKTQRPYFPQELLKQFDPQKTVIVYMIGEKDAGRLSGYKRLMKYNKTTLVPYKDITNPYAYYVYAPHVSLQIPDIGEMSGTNIRKALGDREAKLAQLKQRFTSIMGWFDASIFNLVISKLNTQRGKIKEHVDDWFRSLVNMTDIQRDMFFDVIKKEYGDTKDLLPIIRKYMSHKPISGEEKRKFAVQMKDLVKLIGLGAIAAIPIPGTMLLIPAIVQVAKKFGINLLPDVKESTSSIELPIVKREFWDKVFEEVFKDDRVLNEGGVAGHMEHPFEDMELTFGELKEMIVLGLSGEITVEGSPTEKLDGQNLFVTFKQGRLYAARNKNDIKNGGMNYHAIKTKFSGRGAIEESFTKAFEDLETAIQSLTDRQQKKIFKDGSVWMNLEIVYPKSANVIDYDGSFIVFHGSTEYSPSGEKIDDVPENARILGGMIRQINADIQKAFRIRQPKKIIVKRSKNFARRQTYFISEISKLQRQTKCKDTDTLGTWHLRKWREFIQTTVYDIGGQIDDISTDGLAKRWAFFDKSFLLNKTNIPDETTLSWAKIFDKEQSVKKMKEINRPFEFLILKFGAEVLRNVMDVMSLNPSKTAEKIRNDVKTAINILSNSNNPSDIQLLKTQLKRIQAAGGIESIVPLEGIVFKFGGKIYKLTGSYAPINQLLGYFKYR